MSITTERDGSSLGRFGDGGALGPGLSSRDLSDNFFSVVKLVFMFDIIVLLCCFIKAKLLTIQLLTYAC